MLKCLKVNIVKQKVDVEMSLKVNIVIQKVDVEMSKGKYCDTKSGC